MLALPASIDFALTVPIVRLNSEPEMHKRMFVKIYMGYTFEEIAETEGMQVSEVKRGIAKIRQKLRNTFFE